MKKAHFLPSFFQVGHIKVLNEGEDWNLCQNWKTAPSANIDHFAPSSTQFYCNIHFDLSHFCVYCQWVHQHQFQKFWGNNKLEPTTRSWHWGLKQDDKMGTDIIWKHCQRHNGPEGLVHITSSNTNLDQILSSESRFRINFSTKHQHLQ